MRGTIRACSSAMKAFSAMMASMSGFLAAKSKVSSQTCITRNGMTITVAIKHPGRECSKSTAQPIECVDDIPTGHIADDLIISSSRFGLQPSAMSGDI